MALLAFISRGLVSSAQFTIHERQAWIVIMSHHNSDTEVDKSLLDATDGELFRWLHAERVAHLEDPVPPVDKASRAEARARVGAIKHELINRGYPVFDKPDLGVSREAPPHRRQRKPPVLGNPGSHLTRIMYVECKTGRNDRGGARICRVRFSKSRRTIYVGGLILESCRGAGVAGNYVDANSGFEYWVSGPKKNGRDRHWAGGGDVRIDPDVVDEYWRDVRQCDPPANPFVT